MNLNDVEKFRNVIGDNNNQDPAPQSTEGSCNVIVHPFSENLTPELTIWRYMDMHAALQTIFFNQLRFTRVSRFRDEWESRRGAASRALIEEQDRGMAAMSQMPHRPWPSEPFDDFYRETNFVSSWTQVDPDQMSMWLSYTNSDASIAIGSTINNLSKTSTVGLAFADLGEIKYEDPDIWVHNSRDNRELLFVKRPAFNFEREVRFAVMPSEAFLGSIPKDNHIELDLIPGAVHKLVAHPYMDEPTFRLIIEILKKQNSNLQLEKSAIASKPSY